jgi:hypothetical protein
MRTGGCGAICGNGLLTAPIRLRRRPDLIAQSMASDGIGNGRQEP